MTRTVVSGEWSGTGDGFWFGGWRLCRCQRRSRRAWKTNTAERGKETELCLEYRLREWNMRGPKYFPAKVSNLEQTFAAQEVLDKPRGLQIPKLKYRVGLLEVKTEIPDKYGEERRSRESPEPLWSYERGREGFLVSQTPKSEPGAPAEILENQQTRFRSRVG